MLINIPVIALVVDLIIPVQAVCVEGLKNIPGGTGYFPQRIQVFDSQQPPATVRPGVKEAGYGCDERAEMQISTGSGSESPDVVLCCGGLGQWVTQVMFGAFINQLVS